MPKERKHIWKELGLIQAALSSSNYEQYLMKAPNVVNEIKYCPWPLWLQPLLVAFLIDVMRRQMLPRTTVVSFHPRKAIYSPSIERFSFWRPTKFLNQLFTFGLFRLNDQFFKRFNWFSQKTFFFFFIWSSAAAADQSTGNGCRCISDANEKTKASSRWKEAGEQESVVTESEC